VYGDGVELYFAADSVRGVELWRGAVDSCAAGVDRVQGDQADYLGYF